MRRDCKRHKVNAGKPWSLSALGYVTKSAGSLRRRFDRLLVQLGFGLSSLPLLLIEAVDQIDPACWQRLSQDCIVLIAQGAADHFGKGDLPHGALP